MGLLADLGAGADFDRAFTSWVQMPFADFEREWTEKSRRCANQMNSGARRNLDAPGPDPIPLTG